MRELLVKLTLDTACELAEKQEWNLKKEINKRLIELAQTEMLSLDQLRFAFNYNPLWTKDNGRWVVAGVFIPQTSI